MFGTVTGPTRYFRKIFRKALYTRRKKECTSCWRRSDLHAMAAHSLPPTKIIPEIEWCSLSTVFHNTSLSCLGVAYSGIGLQIALCFFVCFVHYTILFSLLKTCNAWPCHLQIVLRSLPIFSAVFSIVRQFMYRLVSTLM